MINRLQLRNFKCFQSQFIELKSLTVFCGRNNVGKSTAIQGLLFAKEAARHSTIPEVKSAIPLNDIFGYNLGTLSDLLSEQPDAQDIAITLEDEEGSCEIIFEAEPEHLEGGYAFVNHVGAFPSVLAPSTPRMFTYLSAERLGPRDTLPLQAMPSDQMVIGCSGEYVAEILDTFQRDKIRPELRTLSNPTQETLQLQVEAWMDQWIPGLQLRARIYEDASVAEMRFSKKGIKSEWRRPANIGFGVSYSLPIVVAGLIAPLNSVLVIDTPEAHLHPAGQSAIGQYLAQVAASGVQVIIETHSDHVINGIRLAVANPNHPIKFDDVLINNFDRSESGPSIDKIGIDRLGGLTFWPKGFLDQIEQDLAKIARLESQRHREQ